MSNAYMSIYKGFSIASYRNILKEIDEGGWKKRNKLSRKDNLTPKVIVGFSSTSWCKTYNIEARAMRMKAIGKQN